MLNMCNSSHEAIVWGNPVHCPLCRMADEIGSFLDSLKVKMAKHLTPEMIEWLTEQRDRLTGTQ